MDAGVLRTRSGARWIGLFAVLLAAWSALYAMAIPDDLRDASRVFGAEFWTAICTITPDLAGYGRVVAMWAVMSVAMMLPTALGAFWAYDDLAAAGAPTRPIVLWCGYLTVWLGFSLLAAALQLSLFQLDLVSGFGDSRSVWLSAALLALAGLYQFSGAKRACLTACRAPVSFFLAHWGEGPWRIGLRLGVVCVGCCWALMLLAFVGGVMSLAFMGLATVLMTLEKLPDLGRWVDRPMGFALIAGAGALAGLGL